MPLTEERTETKPETIVMDIIKEVAESIEVKIPAYRKLGEIAYYKIYSKEKCISVSVLDGYEGISNISATLPYVIKTIDIPEQEFMEAFEKVNAILFGRAI